MDGTFVMKENTYTRFIWKRKLIRSSTFSNNKKGCN